MGLAEYLVLAQADRVRLTGKQFNACPHAVANVAVLEIDLKVVSPGASYGANRYQKG
jgi:hypothetical protein